MTPSWRNWISLIEKLLSPVPRGCLTCGRSIRSPKRRYPELCSACLNSIPWITHVRCSLCGRHVGCPDCWRDNGRSRHYVMNRSAVAYSGQMREWLAQYKFRGNEAYAPLMARMAGQAALIMKNEVSRRIGVPERDFRFEAVTYVPSSLVRMSERGFNQAEQLASGVAAACGIPVISLLERTSHTEKQSLKSRRERIQDLEGIYKSLPDAYARLVTAARNGQNSPVRVVLVDDVYTTGSTVNACSKVLHEIGARFGLRVEVYVITWARS